MQAQDIINFWFDPEHRSLWFAKSDEFDAKIRDQFQIIHHQATQAELWSWRQTPEGRLAEIIVLDQFSRNLYRDQPQAFAYDNMALILAQEAISLQLDAQLSPEQRAFLYMPFCLRCGCGRFFEVVVKIFHHRFQLQILSGLKGGGVF